MIVDLRIYTCLPNKVADFVALYEKEGWKSRKSILAAAMAGSPRSKVNSTPSSICGPMKTRRIVNGAVPPWPLIRPGRLI